MAIKTQQQLTDENNQNITTNGTRDITGIKVRFLFQNIIDTFFSLFNSIQITWANLANKPTSSVVDIDDAVSKRHTQNTDNIIKNSASDTFITVADVKTPETIIAKAKQTGENILMLLKNENDIVIFEISSDLFNIKSILKVGAIYINGNIVGTGNISVGDAENLGNNATGNRNVAIGSEILYANNSGGSNIGIGYRCLKANTTGNENVALGSSSLFKNTIGYLNFAAVGSLLNNTEGSNNIGIGHLNSAGNTIGSNNIALGQIALNANVNGSYNIAIGMYALGSKNTLGSRNIGIGYIAGKYAEGSDELFINAYDRTNYDGDKQKSLIYGKFNTDEKQQELTVNGNFITTKGRIKNTQQINSDYQILLSDEILICGDNVDAITLTLPLISTVQNGTTFTIKRRFGTLRVYVRSTEDGIEGGEEYIRISDDSVSIGGYVTLVCYNGMYWITNYDNINFLGPE